MMMGMEKGQNYEGYCNVYMRMVVGVYTTDSQSPTYKYKVYIDKIKYMLSIIYSIRQIHAHLYIDMYAYITTIYIILIICI